MTCNETDRSNNNLIKYYDQLYQSMLDLYLFLKTNKQMINTGKQRIKNKRLRAQLGLDRTDLPKRQKREKIMLVSSANMKRYPVYSDIEIGIAEKYQDKILQARLDEDNDTDEGTVMAGLERSIDVLTKSLRTRKNNSKKCSLSKPKGRKQTRRHTSAKSHL